MGFCDGSVADWRSIHALIEITSPEGRSGEVISIKACMRSEEHTSELQSQSNLVCRLLLEKKKKIEENVEYQFQFFVSIHHQFETAYKYFSLIMILFFRSFYLTNVHECTMFDSTST